MTHIEQAIREAESAGLKLPVGYQFVVATNARRFGQNTANEMFYAWLLSKPETWQALGKARAWGKDSRGEPTDFLLREDALSEWHSFINHLADGKDAESFFATLV